MHPELPPPDPHEQDSGLLPCLELAQLAMWFPLRPPRPEDERLAGEILAYRPGALLVYDTRQ